ncbi:hypothetical protein FQR65_LT05913 [Abscondita terminalis]|nr:hypothetical protein FQR65_LT05913 [Abscondita terminalis]
MLKESPAIKLEKKPNEMNINKKKKTISESNDLDFLQLMPITIVKKIFGYLNSKTLKTIKQVNLYWEFAVNDLQADMKGRKTLNKCIKKMKKSLPEEQVYEESSYNILRTAYDKSYPKKRLRRLVHRGAALRKLTNPLVDTTAFKISSWTDKSNDLDSYYLQVENLKLFPRTLTVSHPLHQQAPPRSLKRRYTAYDDLFDVAPEHNEDDNSKKFKQVFDKANVVFSTTPSVLTTLFKNN